MSEFAYFVIGGCSAIVVWWILMEIWIMFHKEKLVSISPYIVNDIVGETPRCPDCGSTQLKLVDVTDGVAWLKGYTPETDFYQCRRCMRQFSDEDWDIAKRYVSQGSTED